MSYNIASIPLFDKQAKRLAKKFPSLKRDLAGLIEQLADEPELGTALGNGFYKIRLAIASKGKGKSGGARVITYVKVARIRFTSPPSLTSPKEAPSRTGNSNRFSE